MLIESSAGVHSENFFSWRMQARIFAEPLVSVQRSGRPLLLFGALRIAFSKMYKDWRLEMASDGRQIVLHSRMEVERRRFRSSVAAARRRRSEPAHLQLYAGDNSYVMQGASRNATQRYEPRHHCHETRRLQVIRCDLASVRRLTH